MINYKIVSIDTKKCKKINNVVDVEATPKHYLFTTKNGKKTKLRTDTWRHPVICDA